MREIAFILFVFWLFSLAACATHRTPSANNVNQWVPGRSETDVYSER